VTRATRCGGFDLDRVFIPYDLAVRSPDGIAAILLSGRVGNNAKGSGAERRSMIHDVDALRR
jgi:hypothetical protein